jgi:hypothetical protein
MHVSMASWAMPCVSPLQGRESNLLLHIHFKRESKSVPLVDAESLRAQITTISELH